MSGWTLPLSSSPAAPSTPGSNRRHTGTLESSSKFFASNPSTTPAGPPPSSVGSFTPADPPPSSIFGSSQLGSGKTLFKSKSAAGANTGSRRSVDTSSKKIDAKQLDRFLNNSSQFDLGSSRGATVQHTFGVPSSSPPSAPTIDGPEQYEDEEDEEESYDEEEDDDNDGVLEEGTMELDPKATDRSFAPGSTMAFLPNGSVAGGAAPGFGSSIMDGTPRGIKRSRGGAVLPYPSPRKGRKQATQESAIPSIAKNIATQLGVAKLEEPDDFILQTEDILQQDLYSTEILGEAHENALGAGLPNVSERLISIWQSQRDRDLADVLPEEDDILGIGPGENTPSMHKAVFLGSLLLQLRHPPTAKGKQALAVTRLGRSSTYTSNSHPSQALSNPTALPKVLLEWLDRNHNPYQSAILELQTYHPSPPAHIHFWEIVLTLSLRGKLADVVRIFKRSDFQHARTARDDGHGSEGYHGLQVRNIERVINRAIQVLELCPAIQDDDWNVTGNEWILFRKRIGHAMNDLATFAEGRDRDLDLEEPAFEASNFGLRSTTMGLSQSARKAESKVPWTIYQNLKSMYAILLGGTTEILAFSQDWVEATVCLTAWWDGNDDEEVVVGSLALTRRSLRHSQSRAERLVDVNANPAYLQRLSYNLALVTDDTDQNPFQISPINPVEVGLASVFEGNVEGVIGLLRGWSLTVASAVVEVASSGGWFESSAGNGVMNGFDESDLMVLSSYGQREQPMTRDSILMEYAKALSEKGTVQGRQSGKAHEGWELSIPLLTRLDDEDMATKRVGEILDRVPLESDARMDKILRICQRFGMAREARSITERYADYVADNSDNYGTALIYFARAHHKKKVKDVLDLLISISLVQSIAYPLLSALDPNLRALLFAPKETLEQLATIDMNAAEMLHTYLTGYATLRRFYDLRDEEVNLEEGHKPTLRPIARKSAAATALLAVINSAADNIHGGLYDEHRGSIVQVDGLLALLGEAIVFVNQPKSILALPQCYALLKAIEDLQTVTSRVYNQCEDCLHSTLVAFKGRAPSSPREILKKQASSMTSASSFSLVGSSMLNSESSNGIGDSRELVKPGEEKARGWDWRKGLPKDSKGGDVLRMLRLGLARDIARHWMVEGG